MASRKVKCSHCNRPTTLVTGREIYPSREDLHRKNFWHCPVCEAYVGCHGFTKVPLGTAANAELRALRSRAHRVFDPIWALGSKSRSSAYRWLSQQMQLESDECHIALFNVEQCLKVIEICEKSSAELTVVVYNLDTLNKQRKNDMNDQTKNARQDIDQTDLADTVRQWEEAKKNLDGWKKIEMQLRQKLVGMYDSESVKVGTNNLELPDGRQLKYKHQLTYTVDQASLAAALAKLSEGAKDRLIEYKPSLKLKEFKQLNVVDRMIMSSALIIKPSSPQLEIK